MSAEQARLVRTKDEPLLSVENLRTLFCTDREVIRAVDGISFDIFRSETVGIVGESGSGKSITARSIMRLVEKSSHIENGRIMYSDGGLLGKPAKQVRSIRGGSIAMVLQDPLASLSPIYTVSDQIKGALCLHRGLGRSKATKEAIELFEAVEIPDAHRRVRECPHQPSGGMCQHTAIAVMLTCDPKLLIYGEPTTTLDVAIQAQILELLEGLREEHNLGIMFITHNMDVIAETADRVNMMYAGKIVESAPVVKLSESPKHPYTQGLPNSVPGQGLDEDERFAIIKGDVLTPNEGPTYCRFASRCPKAFTECDAVHPEPVEVGNSTDRHRASCLLYPDDLPTEKTVAVYHKSGQRGGDTR